MWSWLRCFGRAGCGSIAGSDVVMIEMLRQGWLWVYYSDWKSGDEGGCEGESGVVGGRRQVQKLRRVR